MRARLGPRGVRWRLTVAVSLLFTITLIGGAGLFLNQIEGQLIGDIHDSARTRLERVRATLVTDGEDVPPAAGAAQVTNIEVLDPPVGDSLFVVSATGPILEATTFSRDGAGIASAEMLRTEILQQGEPVPGWLAMAEGPIAVTSLPATTTGGPVRLMSASPLDAVQNTVDTARRVLVAAIPALIGLIGFTAWSVAGRALRPVEAITHQADIISAATPAARLPVPNTRDEVAHLARTLNGMLDRLDRAATTQRQFTADAAHELRTPIAIIRTELEVALREDDPDWSAIAERALAEDVRLGALVDDLLLLARDNEVTSTSRNPFGDVDLDTVVLDAVDRRHNVDIRKTGVAPARIQGDTVELGRAVDHLLDNAVRHAMDTVEVVVATEDDGTVVLHVDDDGTGIPEEHRQRVLERFARLDEARSRDNGGAGLGLAVVDQIMTCHGGEVVISDSPLGGARVSLRFPAVGVDA